MAFLYLFGLLDALQLKYYIRVLVSVLVYSHYGVLDNAESEPAKFFVMICSRSACFLHAQPYCCMLHTACRADGATACLLAIACL